jgi:predicted Zn-dependent protease
VGMSFVKGLPPKDAVRVMSAERWLRTGQAARAVRELQRLSRQGWKHPWTENIVWRAAQVLG